jgi:branched-subunit amino acid aminotransferase/4-amino-4-deoxychorismate lyase
VRGLALHLERLTRDCRTLFAADLDTDQVRHQIRQAIDGTSGSFVVRVTIYDPALELAHPGGQTAPQILVTTRPAADNPAPPMRVQSTVYRREIPTAKHVGLFGAMHARRDAQLAGFDDVLFTDDSGNVLEGATWNIGFIQDGKVVWPSGDSLAGVTMDLIKTCGHTNTATVNLADLPAMQAAFATNTSVGVRPVSAVNATEWPVDHPALEALRKEYADIPADAL